LKITFLNALRLFNSNKKESFFILEDTSMYKIRMSKKSGLPDMDVPSLNENLVFRELNILNLSITIEEKHIVIIPNKKFDMSIDAMSLKTLKNKHDNLDATFQSALERSILNIPLIGNEKKSNKSNWNCCTICLGKKSKK
jgi:hypothetical protein